MKKRKCTESDPVAPFTIFDVAKMLDMEFLENCKSGYQVKDTQNAANVVCPFCGDARGKASIGVQGVQTRLKRNVRFESK